MQPRDVLDREMATRNGEGANGHFKTELEFESGELRVCSRCQWLHCCVRIHIV